MLAQGIKVWKKRASNQHTRQGSLGGLNKLFFGSFCFSLGVATLFLTYQDHIDLSHERSIDSAVQQQTTVARQAVQYLRIATLNTRAKSSVNAMTTKSNGVGHLSESFPSQTGVKSTPQGQVQVSSMQWQGRSLEVVKGEWLYQPKHNQHVEALRKLATKAEGNLQEVIPSVWKLKFNDESKGLTIVQRWLKTHPADSLRPHAIVRGVKHKKRILRTLPDGLPSSLFWFHKQSSFKYARSSTKGGKHVVIALLDTGIAYRSYAYQADARPPKTGKVWQRFAMAPDLAHTRILPGANTLEPEKLPLDDNQHGTFLATLIAGQYGIAPGATLLPVKVLDSQRVGTELSVVQGINYAVSKGADVINLSLVFPANYFPSALLTQAMQKAIAQDVVFIAASGNGGSSTTSQVRFPAAFAPVIAVGGFQLGPKRRQQPAPYSSFGGALDLLAPGGNLSQDNNKDKIPDGIVSQTFAPQDPTHFAPWLMSGTSVSSAYTAGAVALLLGKGIPASSVPSILLRSAQKTRRNRRFQSKTGWGYLQVEKALRAKAKHRKVACYLNVMPVVVAASPGKKQGIVKLEVLNAKKRPLHQAKVWGRWLGEPSKSVEGKTLRSGTVTFTSPEAPTQASIFGFVVNRVVTRSNKECSLTTVFRVSQTALASFQQYEQQGTGSLVVKLAPQALLTAYPSLSHVLQPTNVLIPSGSGLLSSVRVFGDNLLLQYAQAEWPTFSWTSLWSWGAGSASSPLNLGDSSNMTYWTPKGQSMVYWKSLSATFAVSASYKQSHATTASKKTQTCEASSLLASPLFGSDNSQ